MKKNYVLLALFLIATLATTNYRPAQSEPDFPQAGSAGDPVTNLSCAQTDCHNGPAQAPVGLNMWITQGLSLDTVLTSDFQYAANTTYNIGFYLSATTGRYGFQIVALDADNNQAGTMTVTDNQHTRIKTSPPTGNRQYMGHLGANTFKNWVFQWTAPATSTGPVTFYYAYNTADDDDEPIGDVIYQGNTTISPKTGVGVNDIYGKLSNLNIFPNPVTNEFGVSFNIIHNQQVQAQLYTLSGELVKDLLNEQTSTGTYNRNFAVGNLAQGIYMLKLNVGGSSIVKKIVKQ